MRIELRPGVRYSVTVVASIGSPLGLQLLRNRLHATGFDAITITPSKDRVTVSAVYGGKRQVVDVAYDVTSIEAVA